MDNDVSKPWLFKNLDLSYLLLPTCRRYCSLILMAICQGNMLKPTGVLRKKRKDNKATVTGAGATGCF